MIIYEPFKNRPLSDFFDELRFTFPDLPQPLFEYYAVKTARIMARKGNLIRRHAFIESRPGVHRYRLSSPDGMEICGILSIRHNPACSCISTEIKRSFIEPEGFFSCRHDIAWSDDAGDIHLHPQYCHGMYHVRLSVAPALDACELPEKFFTHYQDTLNLGIKAAILLIPGRSWTNLSLGQSFENEFSDRIKQDAIETATHRMRGSIHMNFGTVIPTARRGGWTDGGHF